MRRRMRNAKCGMRNCTRSSARGTNRRSDDGHELTGFVSQRAHAVGISKPTLSGDIKPELCLVGLFLNDSQLRDELAPGPRPTSSPVVRAYGRTRPKKLPGDNVGGTAVWHFFHELNHCQRECSGSVF